MCIRDSIISIDAKIGALTSRGQVLASIVGNGSNEIETDLRSDLASIVKIGSEVEIIHNNSSYFGKVRGIVNLENMRTGTRKLRISLNEILPKNLPRLISVGRLDLNSEGLLLLTNDGALKRALELPSSRILRTYEVRARGLVTEKKLDVLRCGVSVRGINYLPMEVRVMRKAMSNAWFKVGLLEGKNKEIRLSFEAIGLEVNRLIRKSFGPFSLGDLERGKLVEVKSENVQRSLKELSI